MKQTSPIILALILLAQSLLLMGAAVTGTGGGVTGWPTSSASKEVTWADSLVNALKIGNGTNYWAIYNDPTDGLQFVAVCNGVVNDCNYIRKLAAGKKFQVQSSFGTPIFTVDESSGTLLNTNIDCSGATNLCTIPEERWFEVAACQAGVAQLIWNSPSANAPAAACDPDSSPEAYASFDASTDESISMSWVLPTGFVSGSGIDILLKWKAAATSGAAGWCVQMVRVPDGTTSGQSVAAQSSSNCVSDTAKGTTLQENDASITGAICTSCVAGDRIKVTVSRDANGGAVTDSMTGDGHLLMVGRRWKVAH